MVIIRKENYDDSYYLEKPFDFNKPEYEIRKMPRSYNRITTHANYGKNEWFWTKHIDNWLQILGYKPFIEKSECGCVFRIEKDGNGYTIPCSKHFSNGYMWQ